jgi:hypothetical protein
VIRAIAAVLIAALVVGCGGVTPSASVSSTGPNAVASSAVASPRPTVLPDPKHETYGFVPYWEMDDTIADHIAQTDLTTLGCSRSRTGATDGWTSRRACSGSAATSAGP